MHPFHQKEPSNTTTRTCHGEHKVSGILLCFSFLFAFVLFNSCKSEPKFNPELIVGTWNGIDWRVQGKSSGRDAASVFFVFAPFTGQGSVEGTYLAAYGDQKEKGDYKLKGDKLYTTAEDKIEKVVRIVHISADTLILGMNRMGQEEELVLVERH